MYVCVCAVFGVDLTALVTMEGHKVPAIIRDCIQEIEIRGEGRGKEIICSMNNRIFLNNAQLFNIYIYIYIYI